MIPDFLVVGAAKSGTSSLDRYLSHHPGVFIPSRKEAHFYSIPDFPSRFTGPGDDGMNKFTIRSWEEYCNLFLQAKPNQVIGESSAFYLYYPGTAQRIASTLPNAKVIILLRNPVDRAFSAYMHLVRDGRETLDFETALQQESSRKTLQFEPMWLYRELGLYASQVNRYLQYLGKEQVKVLIFEEFVTGLKHSMRDIFLFLGVDPDVEVDTSLRINESGVPRSRALFDFITHPHAVKEWVKPWIPASVRERIGLRAKALLLQKTSMGLETRRELAKFYENDIGELECLLGRSLDIWRRQSERAADEVSCSIQMYPTVLE